MSDSTPNPESSVELWQRLGTELQVLHDAGRSVGLWWRDDDAVEPSRQLDRLLKMARDEQVEPALAVIPGSTTIDLANALDGSATVVWQHGWKHVDYPGEDGVGEGEYGPLRAVENPEAIRAELLEGARRLRALFGPRFRPIFVPPFHCLAESIRAELGELGYAGLSAGREDATRPAPVPEIGVVLDISSWTTRRFVGARTSMAVIVDELRAAHRLLDRSTRVLIGVLSHHLDLDEESWAFLKDLFQFLRASPGCSTVRASELFDGPPEGTGLDSARDPRSRALS